MNARRPAVIWWIRRDLRLADNHALTAAVEHARAADGWLLPLFILDDTLLTSAFVGEKRLAFLFASLRALADDLSAQGSRLIMRRGAPQQWLPTLFAECGAAAIHAERDDSAYARKRDRALAAALPLTLHGGVAIRPPGSVRTDADAPYGVFTPFKRRWLALAPLAPPLPAPSHLPTDPRLDLLAATNPPLDAPPWQPGAHGWPAGEAEAQRRLHAFAHGEDDAPSLAAYAEQRDVPSVEGTSRLSPYLRFGSISARTCAAAASDALHSRADDEALQAGAEAWLSELIWRDFYLHRQAEATLDGETLARKDRPRRRWRNDTDDFAAWQRGSTGYPLVDAAMRQLLQTGWMHNRCRMVVGSFLVKHLLVDWRWGERFFMQCLIDGDPAANRGGWRWVAGAGAEAAPWFRVFNPTLQAQRFDPYGDYLRQWLPELAALPTRLLFEPWKATPAEQSRFGVQPGVDYPLPIVDHTFARARALDFGKRA